MSGWTNILAAGFFVSTVGGLVARYVLVGRWKKRFRSRTPIPVGVLYAQYFSGIDKTDFEFVWNEIAKHLYVNALQLRPDDRFDVELLPSSRFLDPVDELYHFCGILAYERNIDLEQESMRTIGDLVIFLSRRRDDE